MYIYVREDGFVSDEIRTHPDDKKFDPSLLVGFIKVPDTDFQVAGKMLYDAETGTYSPKPADAWEVRRDRDIILETEVDPIVLNPLRWGAMTAEEQQKWKDYRNALLDITEQAGFPENVTWPTKP